MLRRERNVNGLGSVLWVAVAALGAGGPAAASDWPQWRGAKVDGIAAEPMAGSKLSIAWTKEIGLGYAAATIVGDRVYTAGWAAGKDTIWCFSADDGKVLWQHSYTCGRYDKMHEGGPAATPAVDNNRVYSLARDGQFFCLDAKTGKVVWEKQLKREFGVSEPDWAFSGSPVVLGNFLLIDVGKIIAFNKASGQVVWQTDNYGSAYSTPVAFEFQGKPFLATFPKQGLVILDPKSGREIARHGWRTDYGVNAATPIVSKDGSEIFVTSGYNTGCAMLKFDGKSLKVAWENQEMRGQMATPVLIDGYIYGFDESQLKCLDWATGQRKWSERGLGKGALAAASNKLVIQGEDGDIVLAGASPEGFQEITRIKAFDRRKNWVMPVVANGRIYARSPNGALVAIDAK